MVHTAHEETGCEMNIYVKEKELFTAVQQETPLKQQFLFVLHLNSLYIGCTEDN